MKKLGCINACGIANVYKGNRIVAQCHDTPNAIAYTMNKTGGDKATSWLIGTYHKDDAIMRGRVEFAGWMKSDKDAGLKIL